MTYDSNLAERQQEAIPELYDFFYGGTYDRYTSFPEDISFSGFLYKRASIKRTGFTTDVEFGKISMSIQTPLVPTLSTYLVNQPVEKTQVTIYRALYGDLTDFRILFQGEILTVSFKGNVAQANCEMQSHILSQKIPNVVNQSFCNHQVFDENCGLDFSAWRDLVTISGINSDKYTSGSFGLKANGYYTGGQLVTGTDARYIINHIGNDVWIHVPFDSRVSIGSSLYVLPGCNGAPTTCLNKFNNFNNLLAMPYIPSSNPVMWGFK